MSANAEMTLQEMSLLAETWGGDIARWPVQRRGAARLLVGRNAEARRVLAEAKALDRLLAVPDASAAEVDAALADRIVAAARRSPRAVPRDRSEPAQEPASAPVAVRQAPAAAPRAALISSPRRSGFGRVEISGGAALLAASMVLGIFVGGSQLSESAVPALEELTGITITSTAHSLAIAAGEVDEDL